MKKSTNPSKALIPTRQARLTMNLTRCLIVCGLIVCGLGVNGPIRADEIQLRSGGVLNGSAELLEVDGEKVYVITTEGGSQITLPQRAVRKVSAPSAKQIELERMRRESDDTLEAHEKMAAYCAENNMRQERAHHLWQILKFDPDHKAARAGLGFTKQDGIWTTQEQFRKFQGYVRESSAWRLPEEIAMEKREEELEMQVVEWRKRIKYWSDWLTREGKQQEALNNFLLIRDPVAIAALFEAYAGEDTTVPYRRLLLNTMVQIESDSLISILSKIVLYDNEEDLREEALRYLAERKTDMTARFFMAQLDPAQNEPYIINRAGRALEVLAPEYAVRSLIEAVVTEHKRIIGKGSPGNSQSMSFGSGGPNGGLGNFQVGGDGPKEVTDHSQNPAVLAALNEITNANFGYDKQRWLQWYIDKESITEIDLRRAELK